MNRGAAEQRPLQKFRPRKRDVQHLLDPDVLDDDTRRLLLAEVMRPPPAVVVATGSPSRRNLAPLVACSPRSPPASASPKRQAPRPLQPPTSAPNKPVLPAVAGTAASKESGGGGVFAHNLRERVSSGSEDVITAMASRLGRVERQLAAYQSELKEMHDRYNVLRDKYDKECTQRAESDALLVTLYDEKKELQAAVARAKALLHAHGVSSLDVKDDTTSTPMAAAAPTKPTVDLYEGDYVLDKAAPSPRASTGAARESEAVSMAAASPSKGLRYDAALLAKNARILSEHVGGVGVVVAAKGRQGALCDREVVRVVLYKNGICVNSGPFRPYGWPLCDAFLGDLADGFYPYEFKERYPHGFPIELTDRTDEDCAAGVRAPAAASGATSSSGDGGATAEAQAAGVARVARCDGGRRLGDGKPAAPSQGSATGVSPPSAKLTTAPPRSGARLHTLDALTERQRNGGYEPVSREAFLDKLPVQSVSANGHLVSVRAGVAKLLGQQPSAAAAQDEAHATIRHLTRCERRWTEAGQWQRQPQDRPGSGRAVSSADGLLSILVRLASGQKVLLRLSHASTVAELQDELTRAAPELALRRFQLCEGLPLRRLDAPDVTLRELGWRRNVALLVHYLP